jgi:hypothetical protein
MIVHFHHLELELVFFFQYTGLCQILTMVDQTLFLMV